MRSFFLGQVAPESRSIAIGSLALRRGRLPADSPRNLSPSTRSRRRRGSTRSRTIPKVGTSRFCCLCISPPRYTRIFSYFILLFLFWSEKDDADPSNLSLFERIKLFNVKVKENNPQKRDVPRRRLNRFQTQPVTYDEVETARCISPTTYALGVLSFIYCLFFINFYTNQSLNVMLE
jgi:hypothetical protein